VFPRGWVALGIALAGGCGEGITSEPEPGLEVYRIPVVVHVVHNGEPVGEGYNLSDARIARQMEILNEDFRRREGTRGFNTHPDGGDARIEFVLAGVAPDGSPTNGINRVDVRTDTSKVPSSEAQQLSLWDFYAYYRYWDPGSYLNVWTLPLPGDLVDVFLGEATGPETDLPGAELLLPGEPLQAEGILVNAAHFGETPGAALHNLGRTLTHEVGHYLGLLHTWGGGECATNDYCGDTPAVAAPVMACSDPAPLGCDGRPIMVENYMNYTSDACMSTFTNDQVERMRYVLENSPRRKSLLTSPGLGPTAH
jgi:hypothetical protein